MTDQIQYPNAQQEIIADDLRAVNSVANQANAVTGIYGVSGSGKSSLADTAIEYTYETFGKISLVYAADLGGFGNKRLALIRAGIARVWDPRNHINPFETMELISMGGFAAELIDPERGFAAPDVPIVLPRRIVLALYCPQGHEVRKFAGMHEMTGLNLACPTCGVVTSLSNAQKIEKLIVQHRMFRDVGLRVYDSITELNNWGLTDLQEQSAKGLLPTGKEGGAALGSADALRSGQFVFGSGSQAQVGFVQNRTYNWLANIRTIPNQVVPAIATFGVEVSKANDESAGIQVYGPKISGNARTAMVAHWLGNLLHATKEPDDLGRMRHRLWLTNHVDQQDQRIKIPYLAKHRGIPLDMPDYLEDPWSDVKEERDRLAWTACSLKNFFQLLNAQLAKMEAEQKAKYPQTPGMWSGDAGEDAEEVIGTATGNGAATSAVRPADAPPARISGGRGLRQVGRGGGRGATSAQQQSQPAQQTQPTQSPTASVAGTPAASGSPATVVTGGPSPESASAPSVIAQQLTATLANAAGSMAAAATSPSTGNGTSGQTASAVSAPLAPGGVSTGEPVSRGVTTGAPVSTAAPMAATAPTPAATVPAPLPPSSAPAPAPIANGSPTVIGARPLRRVARPPAS